MSIENIAKFQEAVAASPELQDKVRAIQEESAREAAAKIAVLSAEAGTPITEDEFLSSSQELSDEALEAVAGGNDLAGKVATSIFTFGIGCFLMMKNSQNPSENPKNCL